MERLSNAISSVCFPSTKSELTVIQNILPSVFGWLITTFFDIYGRKYVLEEAPSHCISEAYPSKAKEETYHSSNDDILFWFNKNYLYWY